MTVEDDRPTYERLVREITRRRQKNRNYVVKIDVEGYEFEVIRGAKNILSSKKVNFRF